MWVSDGPDDDMKETEEKPAAPSRLNLRQSCTLRIIISREEVNRTRKTIEKEKI